MASSTKRTKMNDPRYKIDESLTHFKKIATQFPNSLVDKTELIHVFCTQGEPHELITAPPRFGKSVNLSMFRSFFEIEVDPATGRLKTQLDPKTQAITDTENYRLFADLNLAIMKYPETVTKYFGRHPVLNVNFKCERDITTVDDALQLCRTVAQESFLEHEYLFVSEKLSEEDRATCKRWCSDDTSTEMDPMRSLRRLAQFLYKHFERDVVFLVDEYDSLVARALVGANTRSVEDVCNFYRVDYRTARIFLNKYDVWMKGINKAYNIAPDVVSALINANQRTRERICRTNGVDGNDAQELVDGFNQDVLSISNISSDYASELIAAHEDISAHDNSIQNICQKPVDMIAPLTKTSNTNIPILKSLVTGISYIAGIGWSDIANNIKPRKFTEYHIFNRFYGFQLQEIKDLLATFATSSDNDLKKKAQLDVIVSQYNGYEYPGSEGDSSKKIYCPWSVLSYLSTGTQDSYWAGALYIKTLEHMFLNIDVKKFLSNLLEADATSMLRNERKLTTSDLGYLKNVVNGITIKGHHELFLNFILELGYLTVDSTKLNTPGYCTVKIPNLEVKNMLLKMLTKHYINNINKCSPEFAENASRISKDMLDCINSAAEPNKTDQDFERALRWFKQELQTLFQQFSHSFLPDINEAGLHCFMAYIFITVEFGILSEHYVQSTDSNKGRLDVLGVKDKFAVLVELKYFPKSNKTSVKALDQILEKKYFKVFEHPKFASVVQHHVLMGISVNEDNNMAISAIRNYKEGTDSVTVNISFDE